MIIIKQKKVLFIFGILILICLVQTVLADTTVTLNGSYVNRDVYVFKGVPDSNYDNDNPGAAYLEIRNHEVNAQRIYIEFNINSIPAGQIITDANLSLYQDIVAAEGDNYNHFITSYWVNVSFWNETNITWNNQPCGSTFGSVSSNCTADTTTNVGITADIAVNWSVAEIIQSAYTKGINATIMLMTSENNTAYATSNKYTLAKTNSNLTISYTPANSAPSADSVSDLPDPVTNGSTNTFTMGFSDIDEGDNVKGYICKSSDCSSCSSTDQTNCWCYSATWQTDGADTCTFDTTNIATTSNDYWLGACDDSDSCDATPLSGGSFTINNAPNGTSVSDSPDPVTNHSNITITMNWNDLDVGDNVKGYICSASDCINCGAGTDNSGCLCYSSNWKTDSTDTCQINSSTQTSTIINYWLKVCDDDDACDDAGFPTSSFTINNAPVSSSVTHSSEPTNENTNTTFTMSWTDLDTGDNIMGYVCINSNCLACNSTNQSSCYCSSSSWQTDGEDTCTFNVSGVPFDDGDNNYWLKTCDDNDACSPILAGATPLTVNHAAAIADASINTTSDYASNTFNFSSNLGEGDGDQLRIFVCDNSACENCDYTSTSNCWCNTNSTPTIDTIFSCTLTPPIAQRGDKNFWIKVCDEHDLCTSTFTPTPNSFSILAPDPSISAGGISYSDTLIEGVITIINITINNNENGDSLNTNISLIINNTIINYTYVNISASSSEMISFPWNVTTGGEYILNASASMNMENIPEVNDLNNMASKSPLVKFVATLEGFQPIEAMNYPLGTSNSINDALGIIEDTFPISYQLYSILSPFHDFSNTDCNFYIDEVYIGSNITDSLNFCYLDNISIEDIAIGTHSFKVNFTNLEFDETPSETLAEITRTFSIVNSTGIITISNTEENAYAEGDVAVATIQTYLNGVLYDPDNLTAILKNDTSTLETYSGIEQFTKTSTGVYRITSIIPIGTTNLYWNTYTKKDTINNSASNTTSITVNTADAILNISLGNQTGNLPSTIITIRDANRYQMQQASLGSSAFTKNIRQNKTMNPSINSDKASINFYNITFNETINLLNITINEDYNPRELNSMNKNITNVVGIENFNYNTTNITIYIPTEGINIDTIWRCSNWSNFNCTGTWSVYTTDFQSNSSYIWFNTTSFSGYAGGELENSRLYIFDSTDTLTTYKNQIVYLYANYTNSTDSSAILDADCYARFNISEDFPGEPWSGPQYNLTYNITTLLYTNNLSNLDPSGEYMYNVTCSATDFDSLTATDSVVITADTTNPTIDSFTGNETLESGVNGTYTCNASDDVELANITIIVFDTGENICNSTSSTCSANYFDTSNFTLRCQATDTSNNYVNELLEVTVSAPDTPPPENPGGGSNGDDNEEQEDLDEESKEPTPEIPIPEPNTQDKLDDLVEASNPITHISSSDYETNITLEDGSKVKFYYKEAKGIKKPVIDLDLSGETVIGEYRQPNLIFIPSFIYVLIALSILIIGTASSIYIETNRINENPDIIVNRLQKVVRTLRNPTEKIELVSEVAKVLTEKKKERHIAEFDVISPFRKVIAKSRKLLPHKKHVHFKIEAEKKVFTPFKKAHYFTIELIAGIRQLEQDLSKIDRKEAVIRYNALIDLSSSLEGILNLNQLTKINKKLIELRKVIFYR